MIRTAFTQLSSQGMTDTTRSFLEKPVLVAGASGFMGSHTARLLAKPGRKVKVLLRKTSNTEAVNDLPVEIHHAMFSIRPRCARRCGAAEACFTASSIRASG